MVHRNPLYRLGCAALYAHHSRIPRLLSGTPPESAEVGEPQSAVELLRRYNAPGGLAHTMAGPIEEGEVAEAATHTRRQLVDRFGVDGPRAVSRLRQVEATLVVPWGDAVVFAVEALRIVLLEATVHLLDVQRALGRAPIVPEAALDETARLLVEVAPAVEFIEAATGRSSSSPLPILR